MSLTSGVLIVAIGFLLAYDVWTWITHGYNTTISWDIHTQARRFLVIPFLVGALAAHLFWCVT